MAEEQIQESLESQTSQETPPAETQKGPPKFFSQLSKENQQKHQAFLSEAYGGKTLNDVVDDLADYHRIKGRAVIVPNENSSTEERAQFLRAIGVPETEDGYDLPDPDERNKDFHESFRRIAREASLTKQQAKTLYDAIMKVANSEMESLRKRVKDLEKSFPERIRKQAGPETDRKIQAYKKFLRRLSDKQVLQDLETSGVLYSEKFALALADVEERLTDMPYIPGVERKEQPSTPILGYGEEFKKRYGGA